MNNTTTITKKKQRTIQPGSPSKAGMAPPSVSGQFMRASFESEILSFRWSAFIQNQSQTWQGIVHGLELLKKGVIWRIGSGSKVKIF
jgi:hypothetical protein